MKGRSAMNYLNEAKMTSLVSRLLFNDRKLPPRCIGQHAFVDDVSSCIQVCGYFRRKITHLWIVLALKPC